MHTVDLDTVSCHLEGLLSWQIFPCFSLNPVYLLDVGILLARRSLSI